jgi:hypothetical protein
LKDEDSILAASGARAKAFVLNKFYTLRPEARAQAQYAKLEFVYPDDLQTLEQILSMITPRTFQFVEYSRKEKCWGLASEDFEAACDKFKRWAVTEEQIKRRKFQEHFYHFIMNELKPGQSALRKFYLDSELLTYVPGRGVVMNDRFPFESYRF